MSLNYQEQLSWLHSLGRLSSKPGLERMRCLMHELGNPQNKLKFVHVAGTNGKGSCISMLSSIVKEAGYTVGSNISPYIIDFRERFQINGVMISEPVLARLLNKVKVATEKAKLIIIEFEAVTAVAFLYFQEENCDIVCLEAGVGGRLDSTNSIENTLVACIMRIGYDHMELLGNTLQEIAHEKCGIIKKGCTVVSCPKQPSEAAQEIEEYAEKASATLVVPNRDKVEIRKEQHLTNEIAYKELHISIPFLGKHQIDNALVVIEAARALTLSGFVIEDKHIELGIAKASFPARIEILSRSPFVILDGAHNQDSARALATTLKQHKISNLTVVFGALQDKQVEKMLRVLSYNINTLYAVSPNLPRAMPTRELSLLAKKHIKQVVECETIKEALQLALKTPNDGILICGSLYLAAEVRHLFMKGRKEFENV